MDDKTLDLVLAAAARTNTARQILRSILTTDFEGDVAQLTARVAEELRCTRDEVIRFRDENAKLKKDLEAAQDHDRRITEAMVPFMSATAKLMAEMPDPLDHEHTEKLLAEKAAERGAEQEVTAIAPASDKGCDCAICTAVRKGELAQGLVRPGAVAKLEVMSQGGLPGILDELFRAQFGNEES